jgi:transcriptional regulator with XRE-family HTH domain
MALFTGTATQGYACAPMPRPPRKNGPWGDAINYWLDDRGWNQTDLRKAIGDGGAALSKNTIGNAARGFDVSTRVLRIIATALGVPVEAVLVSPNRQSAQEERRQMIFEITERVTREVAIMCGIIFRRSALCPQTTLPSNIQGVR